MSGLKGRERLQPSLLDRLTDNAPSVKRENFDQQALSMQQLRQSAASGEGQMRATLDLAKAMGSDVSRQQEMRKARGAVLFQEYKKKMGMVQSEAATPSAPASEKQPERQKIAEK